jgi:glycosyltransferase involved in cell wall biosynthesis
MPVKKILWITWETQRRNRSIADAIGARYCEFAGIHRYPRLVRYLVGIGKTFRLLVAERPDTVIAQDPSVALALFVVLARPLFRYRAGIDMHNVGFALYTDLRILRWASRFIQRHADFVIAHNDPLRDRMAPRGGTLIALPDRIPDIPEPDELPALAGDFNVLFICTFSPDEPVVEVLEAFRGAARDLYVTGNYAGYPGRDLKAEYADAPNIHLMGRIPWNEYDAMLHAVDAAIVLTTRDDCLCCGCYEAVAVGKPLITTDTRALRGYFHKGAAYVDNTAASISAAVDHVAERHEQLVHEQRDLKNELIADWETRKQKLLDLL